MTQTGTLIPEDHPYLIFDFDGTIGDSNAVFDEFYMDIFSRYGAAPDMEYLEEQKTLPHEVFCRDISRAIGGALTQAEVARQLEDFLKIYYARQVPPTPGILDYLARIEARGTPKCIVTATPYHLIELALDHLGLSGQFSHILSPELVGGRGKSFPDIYEKAMDLMGHNEPSDYCVFDDAIAAVQTAKTLGMFTVGIHDSLAEGQSAQMKKICDLYIQDFRDLL